MNGRKKGALHYSSDFEETLKNIFRSEAGRTEAIHQKWKSWYFYQ